MLSRNIPKRLWDYGLTWICELMQRTVNSRFDTFSKTSFSIVLGDILDISEYTDFTFWDRVWVTEGAGLSETILAKFFGISHGICNAMSYHVLKDTGRVITRGTSKPVTTVERKKESFVEKLLHFTSTMNSILFSYKHIISNQNSQSSLVVIE